MLSQLKVKSLRLDLFITRIENNCILAELALCSEFMGYIAPFISDANVFTEFVKNVKNAIDFFVSLVEKEPAGPEEIPYGKKQLRHFKDIVSLIAKNPTGNLRFTSINYFENSKEGIVNFKVTCNADDAKKARKGISVAEHGLDSTSQVDYEKVLMCFHQTNRDDPKITGNTGDRAIIRRVTKKKLKCYLVRDLDSQKIRHELDATNHNPLPTSFVVVQISPGP
jgi:hypothetical protein